MSVNQIDSAIGVDSLDNVDTSLRLRVGLNLLDGHFRSMSFVIGGFRHGEGGNEKLLDAIDQPKGIKSRSSNEVEAKRDGLRTTLRCTDPKIPMGSGEASYYAGAHLTLDQ
jgi:hypothetical protein